MKEIGNRLRALREGVKLSQAKIANLVGTTQATINRYETGVSSTPLNVLIWYADHFDVSMDYIFARTEKPQGKLYDYRPKFIESNEEFKQFLEMCFDPTSPMNDRLKQALFEMMQEAKK